MVLTQSQSWEKACNGLCYSGIDSSPSLSGQCETLDPPSENNSLSQPLRVNILGHVHIRVRGICQSYFRSCRRQFRGQSYSLSVPCPHCDLELEEETRDEGHHVRIRRAVTGNSLILGSQGKRLLKAGSQLTRRVEKPIQRIRGKIHDGSNRCVNEHTVLEMSRQYVLAPLASLSSILS